MLTLSALELCSCFGVRKKRKKPGTNMKEVLQSGSLAAFKIRKAVRFKQEEDQPQPSETPLQTECRSQLKCVERPERVVRGWGAWWSLEELQPKEIMAQLFLEAASCLEGPAVKFQHVLRLIVKKKVMPCFNCRATKLLSDVYFQLLLKPHLVTITSYSLSPLKAQSEGVFCLLYRNNSRSYFSVAQNWWHPLLQLATTRADTRPLK